MRQGLAAISAILLAATAMPAVAAQGSYAGALRKMLAGTAAGTCPADIMGDKLLSACREQLPKLKPEMSALGPVKSLVFVKADEAKGERMETYKVTFAKGQSSTWHIGGLHDGKFKSAYSLGE